MKKDRNYDLINVTIYFTLQIGVYIFTIIQLKEMNTIFAFVFVYTFPFILFYEGLYFRDKEYNYAQIIKILLLSLLIEKNDVSLCYIFSILTWLHSVYNNVFFLQQIYSLSENNKKNKNLIKISFYYLFNFIPYITIFWIFKDRLFECIALFGINFFYLLILYSQSISYSPYFNITESDPNYFIPSSKIRFSIIDSLASFKLLELVWILPVFGGVLYLQKSMLTLILGICITIIFTYQFIKNNISVYKQRVLNLYLPLLINLFISCLLIYAFRNYSTLSLEIKRNISSMIVSVIAADLIFNFTAMFILMQENYNKYQSSYLLKNIVTKWTIFFSVIVPVIFILILVLDIIPENYFMVYSVICICSCIACSIWLLNRLKRSLNTVDIILGLMANTNSNTIRSYSNGDFISNNNDIDTILKISVDAISSKNFTELKSMFELLLHWIEKYRQDISISIYSPYFESQNKFYSFIDILITAIVNTKSVVIIKQFSSQVYEILRFADIEKEYKQYHIFYNSLNKLIQGSLNIDDADIEDTAKYIVNLYFYKAGYILPLLEDSKRKENLFVVDSDDYRDFENYYFNPIEKTIRKAVKQKKFSFLKRIDLFSMFFQFVPEDIILSENHLKILQEITNTYSDILRESNYNQELIRAIFSDYESIMHYLSYLKMPDMLHELMSNVVFNSIRDIYSNLINNKYLFDEMDLEILYSYFFGKKRKTKDNDRYLTFFCNVVSTYFDYGIPEIDKNTQNRVWSRIIQLKSIFEEEKDNELLNYMDNQIELIIEKHPSVASDYQQYEDAWKNAISSWNSYQEEFNRKYN